MTTFASSLARSLVAAGAIGVCALAATPALADGKGMTTKTFEIKNKSQETANDLHVRFKNKETGVATPIAKGRSEAFSDPPGGEGSNSLDWPKAGGSGEVGPGESDRISVCGDDPLLIIAAAYFTMDKKEIPNSADFKFVSSKWEVTPTGSLTLSWGNPYTDVGVRVAQVSVFTGNSLSAYVLGELGYEYTSPTGSLAFAAVDQMFGPGSAPFTLNLGAVGDTTYQMAIFSIATTDDPTRLSVYATAFWVPAPGTVSLALLGSLLAARRRR